MTQNKMPLRKQDRSAEEKWREYAEEQRAYNAEQQSLKQKLAEWRRLPCHQKAWTILLGTFRLSFTWMRSVKEHIKVLELYKRVGSLSKED